MGTYEKSLMWFLILWEWKKKLCKERKRLNAQYFNLMHSEERSQDEYELKVICVRKRRFELMLLDSFCFSAGMLWTICAGGRICHSFS